MVHELLPEIEAARDRLGVNDATFGRLIGDRYIIAQLREGRRMWPETVDKVRARITALEAERSSAAA